MMNTIEQLVDTRSGTTQVMLTVPVHLHNAVKNLTEPRQFNPLVRRLLAEYVVNKLNTQETQEG